METQNPSNDADNKARITITLRQSLLPLLDRFVDGQRIRNRSHAIEFILGQHLGAGVETAVIFAAGSSNGELDTMKVVKNKPAIAWTLDRLKDAGVRTVILVIDEFGAPLKEYVGEGERWGLRVTFVKDTDRKGTAYALQLVKPLIDETFILIYGDVLADINLADVVEFHREHDVVGTVSLTYKAKIGNFGVARLEGNYIVDYSEKPGEGGQHGLINAGIYIFEPKIFSYVSDSNWLEEDVLPVVAKSEQLLGYPFDGGWFDLSTEDGLKAADEQWNG